MSRVRSLFALSRRRRALLVGALALTALARAGFAVTSYRRTARLFDRVPSRSSAAATPEDVRWAVRCTAAQVPGATCLVKGLVAHALCRRHGHPAELYVGVEREREGFAAHSWVESDGRVIVGDDVDLDRYEPLGVLE